MYLIKDTNIEATSCDHKCIPVFSAEAEVAEKSRFAFLVLVTEGLKEPAAFLALLPRLDLMLACVSVCVWVSCIQYSTEVLVNKH